jgi:hypothetical protein
MLLAIGAIIISISLLITCIGNLALAQNITTDTSWLTYGQNGINFTITKPVQSLTIEGLSPQGADDLAIACTFVAERC